MGLTLSPETRFQVEQVVRSGRFASAEAVQEAVLDRLSPNDSLADWSAEELNQSFTAALREMVREQARTPVASAAA